MPSWGIRQQRRHSGHKLAAGQQQPRQRVAFRDPVHTRKRKTNAPRANVEAKMELSGGDCGEFEEAGELLGPGNVVLLTIEERLRNDQ